MSYPVIRPTLLLLAILAWPLALPLWAQPATPAVPPLGKPSDDYDKRLRMCRAEATQQDLRGEARQAFIAQCMKGLHVGRSAWPASWRPAAAPLPTAQRPHKHLRKTS